MNLGFLGFPFCYRAGFGGDGISVWALQMFGKHIVFGIAAPPESHLADTWENDMTVHFDQDNGPGTTLTEEHCAAIEEGIKEIDFELGRCGHEDARELNRKRAHLVAELAAGKTLPFPDEE